MFVRQRGTVDQKKERRGSSGSRRGDGDKGEHRHRRTRTSNIKTTVENIIASVSSIRGDTLDKDSVVEMVKSMYTWIVFDPNYQISLPSASGSSVTQKMWPHGAVVDSRRSGAYCPEDGDPRVLEDLADDVASTLASSVVSSTIEEEKMIGRTGNIMMDPHDSSAMQYAAPLAMHSRGSNGPTRRPDNFPPPAIHEEPDAVGGYSMPVYRPAPLKGNGDGHKYIPRFSIIGGPQPPVDVPATPDNVKVPRPTRRVPKSKPKVGAADRGAVDGGDDGDSGAIPVTFVD